MLIAQVLPLVNLELCCPVTFPTARKLRCLWTGLAWGFSDQRALELRIRFGASLN